MLGSKNFGSAAHLAAFLVLALGAALPAAAGSVPTYAMPAEESIKGTIYGFNGTYTLYLHDDRGYNDNVTLHDGTVIHPTGIRLIEGMRVTIYGHADGSTFQANTIEVAIAVIPPYYGGPYGPPPMPPAPTQPGPPTAPQPPGSYPTPPP